MAIDISQYAVGAEKVRRICKPEDFEKEPLTPTLDIPIDMVGQERAKAALDFALSSPNKFHVVVLTEGLAAETVKEYLTKKIEERKQKGENFPGWDYVYLHNFKDRDTPQYLIFPAGQGSLFRQKVKEIKERLMKDSMAALLSKNFRRAKTQIINKIGEEADRELREFYDQITKEGLLERWRKNSWGLLQEREGAQIFYYFFPVKSDGTFWETKEFSQLSLEEKTRYGQGLAEIQEDCRRLEEFYNELQQRVNQEMEEQLGDLKDEIFEQVLQGAFRPVLRQYSKNEKAKQFLQNLKEYARENKHLFFRPASKKPIAQEPTEEGAESEESCDTCSSKEKETEKSPFIPFEVNLLVDNEKTQLPPIIIETSPTYAGLFGKIGRETVIGQLVVETTLDHTLIKAGSFHRANGGFIILDLNDILYTKEIVYLGLARTLKENKLFVKDDCEELGHPQPGKTLNPEPIPLELKVILMVKPELYYLLWDHPFGEEFLKNFRIKVEFDDEVKYEKGNLGAYSDWIDGYCQKKGLLRVETGAKAKIIEFLLRGNESQENFSWDIERLKTLIKEAQFYAKKEGASSLQERHIKEAIRERIYRSNLIEEKMRRLIDKGKILVKIEGEQVGQINGLAVYRLDEHSFAFPRRITVNTCKGTGGLVNIEKESGFSGKTHTKGVEVLKGFFNERYGQDKDLNFRGTVVFEQIYDSIEGPSASAAELFALISSLARKPIKQGIAITGTVDQKGNIGPIGGVNQKIEGFFRICKIKGLTGEQGVIIPETNLNNLMLDEEVVEAILQGRFHIYAIKNVDQGVEVLMDSPAKDIDDMVNQKLGKWAKKGRENEKSDSQG